MRMPDSDPNRPETARMSLPPSAQFHALPTKNTSSNKIEMPNKNAMPNKIELPNKTELPHKNEPPTKIELLNRNELRNKIALPSKNTPSAPETPAVLPQCYKTPTAICYPASPDASMIPVPTTAVKFSSRAPFTLQHGHRLRDNRFRRTGPAIRRAELSSWGYTLEYTPESNTYWIDVLIMSNATAVYQSKVTTPEVPKNAISLTVADFLYNGRAPDLSGIIRTTGPVQITLPATPTILATPDQPVHVRLAHLERVELTPIAGLPRAVTWFERAPCIRTQRLASAEAKLTALIAAHPPRTALYLEVARSMTHLAWSLPPQLPPAERQAIQHTCTQLQAAAIELARR